MKGKESANNSYTVTSKEISEILGLSDRRIRQLANDGALVRVSHGKFDLSASIRAYIDFNINKEKSESEIDKTEEEAKWTRARREKTELEVKIIKGELHRSADVERVMNHMLGAFRGKLLSLPSKIAPQLLAKTDINIVKDKLKDAVYEAMTELADYDHSTFYTKDAEKLFSEDDEDVTLHDEA